jgi:thymidylate kinase
VAIVGPDGVGKSTLIDGLRKLLPQLLPINGVMLRHWRPSLLPALGRLAGQEVPRPGVAHPPRRTVGKFRWIRNFYYSFDFTLGAWLKDQPLLSFNKIIIYDRCYLDMQADPLRFGLPDAKGLQSLARFYRHPDLVILLKDSPDSIYIRKPELSVTEITDIYARWEVIGQRTRGFHAVSADTGVAETAEKVAALLVETAINLLLRGSK